MHRIFQTFVDALESSRDAEALRSALVDVAVAFELPLVAYFVGPGVGNPETTLISNYPVEWTDHYLRNRYDRLDPVIHQLAHSAEPFSWVSEAQSSHRTDAQHRFLDEARTFGIRAGLTVPIPEPVSRIAALTFASDRLTPSLQRAADAHGHILQLMAIYFHRQAKRLPAAGPTINGVRLTPREFECLHWAARGKSARDIGQILGVSRRTAAFHLDNARAKLEVHSITQAVAILAASGISI
jgi:DNA-binding CsgD family transcriptional regulator